MWSASLNAIQIWKGRPKVQTWSAYAGEAPFAGYSVLCKVQGAETADTLAVISDMGQTVWGGSEPIAEDNHVYWVAVRNRGGFETAAAEEVVLPFSLPDVQLTGIEFAAQKATARLQWTTYTGPHFRAYRVQRRATEGHFLPLIEIGDSAATTWTDTKFLSNTVYGYRVDVVTVRNEVIVLEHIK